MSPLKNVTLFFQQIVTHAGHSLRFARGSKMQKLLSLLEYAIRFGVFAILESLINQKERDYLLKNDIMNGMRGQIWLNVI